MAPLGSVIKNGLIFGVISAGILYGASFLLYWGIVYAIRENQTQGRNFLFVALLIIVVGIGLVFHKTLSDTVEDGMYEF